MDDRRMLAVSFHMAILTASEAVVIFLVFTQPHIMITAAAMRTPRLRATFRSSVAVGAALGTKLDAVALLARMSPLAAMVAWLDVLLFLFPGKLGQDLLLTFLWYLYSYGERTAILCLMTSLATFGAFPT